MYTLLLAIIYLAFISLGLPDSLLGAGWPAMHPDLGVPTSYMGIVSMVISFGTIISSLMSDRLTRRFGTRYVTLVSVFMTAGALLGFSASRVFPLLIVFAVPYGLGAGAIDAALNNYVALHYSSRHMSWLHCFWGVGTIVSPFVMSFALTNYSWGTGYRIIAILQFAIGLILLITLPVWNIHENAADDTAEHVGIRDALKITGVPYLLTGFLCYCAAEATSMYWASTYLVEVRGVTAERAAGYASLFYIGITAGRFISGLISNRLGDRNMIRLGTAILLAGIVMLVLPIDSQNAALAAFITIGLGCAPIYPSIIHSTPSNFGAENSGAIIGIQMASAYAGSTFMPPIFGLLGSRLGFHIMPFYLALFAAVMIVMTEKTFTICRD